MSPDPDWLFLSYEQYAGEQVARFKAEIHFNPQLLSEKCPPPPVVDSTVSSRYVSLSHRCPRALIVHVVHSPWSLCTAHLLFSPMLRYLAAHNNLEGAFKTCRAVETEQVNDWPSRTCRTSAAACRVAQS